MRRRDGSGQGHRLLASAQPFDHALRRELLTWMLPDLIDTVCDYAVSPVLLICGGQRLTDCPVVEVWFHDEWTSIPNEHHSGRKTHSVPLDVISPRSLGWEWFSARAGEAVRHLSYEGVVKNCVEWDAARPSHLHIRSELCALSLPRHASRVVMSPDGLLYTVCRKEYGKLESDVIVATLPRSWYCWGSSLGEDRVLVANVLMVYDCGNGLQNSSAWRELGHCPVRSLTSVAFAQGNLYSFMMGVSCVMHETATDTWHTLPDCRYSRSYMQPALDDKRGHIYLVGASPAASATLAPSPGTSCERLSVRERKWTDMPDMNCDRWGSSLVMLTEDRLVVIGGRDTITNKFQHTVECLSVAAVERHEQAPATQPKPSWIMMPRMTNAREDALALVGHVYG